MITDVIENGFILKTYVIWGSTLYLNQVNLYPELKIIDLYPDKDLAPWKYDKHLLCSYSVDFNITTWNQNSKAKLKASVQYEHVRNTFPIIYIVIGYVSFQAITAFVIFKVCSWIINSKSQEMKDYEQQQNDARSRDFKSKFKTYFSTPNLDETEPLIIEKWNSDYIESIISNKYNRKYNNSYHEGSIQSKEKKPLLNKKIYRVRFFDEENSD